MPQSFCEPPHPKTECQERKIGDQTSAIGVTTYLFWSDWLLGCLVQFFNGPGVVTKVFLAANEDDGVTLAEMKNLRDPLVETDRSVLAIGLIQGIPHLFLDVVKRIRRINGEANQDHVRIRV